jgi:hypothetical protein
MLLLRKALFPAVGTHLSIPLDAAGTLLVSTESPMRKEAAALRDSSPVSRNSCT